MAANKRSLLRAAAVGTAQPGLLRHRPPAHPRVGAEHRPAQGRSAPRANLRRAAPARTRQGEALQRVAAAPQPAAAEPWQAAAELARRPLE
jgi:hypothetical protein